MGSTGSMARAFKVTKFKTKMAGSGLSYGDLLNVFTKFGETGLIAVLSCPPKSGKVPRVTKNTRILTQIIQHFKSINKE